MNEASWAIEVRSVTLDFGNTRVLRDVSLRVPHGGRLVVLGPNGAGKTTLLRVLATLQRPSSGEVRVAGFDAERERARIRGRIGVLGHQTYLHTELTVAENLRYYGRLYRVPDLESRIGALLESVGLYRRRDDLAASLSRGLLQRLAVARAVLHDPPILLLDEPDTGLDLQAFQLLEPLILGGRASPRTVVFSTHDLGHALRMADSVAILVGGKLAHLQATAPLDSASLEALYQRVLVGTR